MLHWKYIIITPLMGYQLVNLVIITTRTDSIGKQLNIKPAFIYETISEDKQIPIDIPVKDMKLDDPKSFVNDKMFSALEAMYNELFT